MHHLEHNVPISVLNGALWDMGQVHCRIAGFGVVTTQKDSHAFNDVIHSHDKNAAARPNSGFGE